MLFAAGFGTRMRHLTQDRPKPLIRVAGKPLIDHAIDLGRDADCAPIVANLHYKPEMLDAHLAGTDITTIIEVPDILDTGGGLRNALPLLGARTVFTLNTDAIWAGPNPLRMLAQAWRPKVMDALLIIVPLAQTEGRTATGDFTLQPDGQITRGGDGVYGGVQIIKTDALKDIPEPAFSLNLLWDQMAKNGRLHGLHYTGKWCDVGHPDGIAIAEHMLEASNV